MVVIWQAIHTSIAQGKDQAITTAFEDSRDVISAPICHGLTALQLAAKLGQTHIVKSLLKTIKSLPRRERCQTCVKCLELAGSYVDVVRAFVQDPETWPPKTLLSTDIEPLYSILTRAHVNGSTDVVKYLLDRYPEFNTRREQLLDIAFTHGHRDLVRFWYQETSDTDPNPTEAKLWQDALLQCVAGTLTDFENLASKQHHGDSIIEAASRAGDVPMMMKIVDYIPNKLRKKLLRKAGLAACYEGQLQSLKWLVRNSLNPHFCARNEWKNLLIVSTKYDHLELVEFLVQYREKKRLGPWKKAKYQRVLNKCLLIACSFYNDERMVEFLLRKGAKDDTRRALLNACEYGNALTVKLLLRHHKKLSGYFAMRCLSRAVRSEFESVATIELLLETGLCDVNGDCEAECPYHLWTPITMALQFRMWHLPHVVHPETFRLLIEHGGKLWSPSDTMNAAKLLMVDRSDIRALLHTTLDLLDCNDVFPQNFHFYTLPDVGPISWKFLPKLMEKLCGSRSNTIVWNDLLMLLMLDDNCAHYCETIVQCGFRISDSGFDRIEVKDDRLILPPDYVSFVLNYNNKTQKQLLENFGIAKTASVNNDLQTPPSLKSLTRVKIRTTIRSSHDRKSMRSMVKALNTFSGLPKPLVNYVNFEK